MTTRISSIRARPVSFPVPPEFQVKLGIGRTVKRDAVLVRVEADDGLVGWGEAHAARAPTAIAELINSTLAQLVQGMDSEDTAAVRDRIYHKQLASHGAGAAAAIGLSGIDLALWDLRGKRAGRPVCALLGATPRPVRAYAGGISLGFDDPHQLVEEARALVNNGAFRALKLRLGDTPARDVARVRAVRAALGDDVDILTDANTAYSLDDFNAVVPALAECGVGWLEEPFPAHDFARYRSAKAARTVPLAAGENHYTLSDFERLLDDGVVRIWQPDLSKTGGLTEALKIAALAAANDIAIHPHTSLTALNMAATLHFLAAIGNAGYYEADVTRHNPLRDHFGGVRLEVDAQGCYTAPPGSGFGVVPDGDVFARFPAVAGAGYV